MSRDSSELLKFFYVVSNKLFMFFDSQDEKCPASICDLGMITISLACNNFTVE